MSLRILTLSLCVALTATFATADHHEEKPSPKCPVSGADADMEKLSAYKGGEVYFCCGGCKAKFDADSSKFATKANHQLVVTEQATQKGCPFSGGAFKESKSVAVGGVDVGFCCGKCQGKVAAADEAGQYKMVFSNEAFKKGFEVAVAAE